MHPECQKKKTWWSTWHLLYQEVCQKRKKKKKKVIPGYNGPKKMWLTRCDCHTFKRSIKMSIAASEGPNNMSSDIVAIRHPVDHSLNMQLL